MNFNKNYLYIPIILIITILLGILSYNYYRKLKQPIAPVINAIPSDAIFIMEFNNLYELWNSQNTRNEIWKGLQKIKFFQETQNSLTFINTLININKDIKQVLSSQKASISMHNTDNGNIGFLYLCNVPVTFQINQVTTMLSEAGIKVLNEEKKDKNNYFSVVNNKSTYYYTIQQGVFIGSIQKELIEKAINQINNEAPISKDENYVNVNATAGKKVDANIYLNYKNLSNWLTKSLNPSSIINMFFLNEIALWTEFDMMIKDNQLLLNGYTSSDKTYLELFKNENPQETKIAEILPDNTTMFTNINFCNYATYHTNYKNYLKNRDQIINYDKELNKLNLKVKFNLRDNFIEWMGNSFALVALPSEPYSADNLFVVCNIKDNNITDSCLKIIAKASQNNSDNQITNKIQLPSFLKILLGNICPAFNETWFETAGNYVIFGNSKQALEQYKEAILKGKLLINSTTYNKFNSTISSLSNIYIYFNFDYAADFIKKTLHPSLISNFDNNFAVLQGFHQVSLQFSNSEKRFYTTFNIEYQANDKLLNASESKEEPLIEVSIPDDRQIKLDNQVINQPYLVKNCISNEKNILIFDITNNLYCIDKEGIIKWKINVGSKPLSKVYEVDYQKNNKTQFLFNTENAIYLVDAKGQLIDNYPIKLSKKATSGMCLIDYEKKKDYRILIPTSDKKISCFNIKGNQVLDFKSTAAKEILETAPQHIIFGGKDNIIACDRSGNFTILDRKGNERLIVKSQFHKNPLSKFYYDGKYLLTSDLSNNIKYISTKGEVDQKTFKTVNGNAQFVYEDFNNDGTKDYIFITSKQLYAFKKDGKVIYSYNFKSNVYPNLMYFDNTGKEKLFAVLGMDKQLYIFDKKGLKEESVNFKGETFPVISIFNNKKQLNLFTGYGNKLLKYTFK